MSSTTNRHVAENPPKGFSQGNKMAKFSPRQLNIVWGKESSVRGKESSYWKIPQESNVPAELLQVCWLEVSGSIPISSGPKKYKVSFELSLKSDAFGWNNCPVYVMAKFGEKGKYSWKKILLQASGSEPVKVPTVVLEIERKESTPNDTIHFGLYEVWSGKWKGGLLLHCAMVEQV